MYATLLFAFSLFFLQTAFANIGIPDADFEQWAAQQFNISKIRLRANISRTDTLPGTVVASPSKSHPDYFYHWNRDASLVMNFVIRLYKNTTIAKEKDALLQYLYDFTILTHKHQNANTPGGLGEVKFYVDGSPFTGPWGRPQNDGPAIRAMAMTKFARILLAQGKEAFVREHLYDGNMPTQAIIKRDLEYVSHNWQNHDFDLWEEVKGHNFFTRLMQRRALLDGALLATDLGDIGAAAWYRQQAEKIGNALNWHWDSNRGIFLSTLNRVGGIGYKSGLDASVILGLIYSERTNDDFGMLDDRFMSNANKIIEKFSSNYSINRATRDLGPAIGRYAEDTYDGYSTGRTGNPWFLITSGFANYHYKLASAIKEKGAIKITYTNQNFFRTVPGLKGKLQVGQVFKKGNRHFSNILNTLIQKGDSFLKRVRLHAGSDGSMSEQMNRESGVMQGAKNLTWSHSSYLHAIISRNQFLQK